MDFWTLPPEINSARMHSGPGAGPAAAAWDGLATELHSTATSWSWVVSGLANQQWLGPSSVSMATAAGQYASWIRTTAAWAEEAAAQAKAAAGACETAFAMTVPPAAIAANRGTTMSLVSTNVWVKTPRRSRPAKRNMAKCGSKTSSQWAKFDQLARCRDVRKSAIHGT